MEEQITKQTNEQTNKQENSENFETYERSAR